jgi:hypothetical protein
LSEFERTIEEQDFTVKWIWFFASAFIMAFDINVVINLFDEGYSELNFLDFMTFISSIFLSAFAFLMFIMSDESEKRKDSINNSGE